MATAIEYGLIASLVVVAAISGMTALTHDQAEEKPGLVAKAIPEPRKQLATPIYIESNGLHVDFGTVDTDGSDYVHVPFVVKGRKGYGELHCALYGDNGRLLGSDMSNWIETPESGELTVKTADDPTRIDCWMRPGL